MLMPISKQLDLCALAATLTALPEEIPSAATGH